MLGKSKQIEKFELYHKKARRRLLKGETVISAYGDKPKGYDKWAKKHFKKEGGVRLPKPESIPLYECWNCGKPYSGDKCPYCKAFKPNTFTYPNP